MFTRGIKLLPLILYHLSSRSAITAAIITPTATSRSRRTFHSSSSALLAMGRKAGVSSPEELKKFVQDAGERLLVVDGKCN